MRGVPFDSAPRDTSEVLKGDSSLKPTLAERVIELTGGRMALLGKIAHAKNEEEVEHIMDRLLKSEKAYLLSRIGLIPDHDDDFMDEVCLHLPGAAAESLVWNSDVDAHFAAKMVILQLAAHPRVY